MCLTQDIAKPPLRKQNLSHEEPVQSLKMPKEVGPEQLLA